jgi:hypothetical protein
MSISSTLPATGTSPAPRSWPRSPGTDGPARGGRGDRRGRGRGVRQSRRAAEDHFLNELSTPSQKLGEVAVKLAAAYRTAWWNNHGNGVYGDAALSLIGSALSDLILLREAEVERRRRVEERAS